MSVSTSSRGLGRAAVCDCGTPWTFLLPFFLLDEDNVTLPAIDNYIVNEPLSSLVFTTDEVKAILRTLPVGKAVGPDRISNRILRELASEL